MTPSKKALDIAREIMLGAIDLDKDTEPILRKGAEDIDAYVAEKLEEEKARKIAEDRAAIYTGKCGYSGYDYRKCGAPARLISDNGGPGAWSAWRCDEHTYPSGYPM